ncbi:MAG TPA: glycosyltransferase [Nocardioidaceae bacterium]|nr:glycosyltransferase [Nocardioidaceae bacterium]
MTTNDGRVTTVVVSRNRRDQLLHSLARHETPVILVDNGSTDGTQEAVREQLPHVDVVALEENHGSPGRNIGVERARTPYVAFADDDSWWASGSLAACADAFDRNPGLGLVAGRMLVGPEQRLDPLCEVMARSPLPARPGTPGTPVLGFMACGAVVRREAFLGAGGFDEVTFFLGEEDRLAWDMAANGWDLVYLPEVVAHHHPLPAASRTGRQRLITRNTLLTATMRRPWSVVLGETVRACCSGREGIGGVVDAIPRLRGALALRARLPAAVEAQVRTLQA